MSPDWEGGRKGGREGGRGKEGGREGGRGKERGKEGGREGGREGSKMKKGKGMKWDGQKVGSKKRGEREDVWEELEGG